MPSLASRIIELHAQKFSRAEIIHFTGCTSAYLRSVLSRAAAPDEETRKRREKPTLPPKGSPKYNASLAGWSARSEALRKGKTIEQARRAQRKAKRDYLKAHRVDAGPSRKDAAIAPARDGNELQHKEARL